MMGRRVDDKSLLARFAVEFSRVVERFTEYIIVSGFVVIVSGRARGTEDVDMIIRPVAKEKFASLHEALLKAGFVCLQSDKVEEIYSYLKENLSVRYTYKDIPLPEMEMKFVQDKLDDYQLKTKKKLSLTGLDLYFSSVEMNIAFKEEYLKSEKDLEDARHLRRVYARDIDEEEIKKIRKMLKEVRMKDEG